MISGVLKRLVRGGVAEAPAAERASPASESPAARERGFRMAWLADEKHGVVYCPIPKNACSTIKYWLTTSAEGARPDLPRGVIHPYSRKRLALERFSEDEAAAIVERSVSFIVLRDPAARLVSAFASKLCQHEPGGMEVHAKRIIEACVVAEGGEVEYDTTMTFWSGGRAKEVPASSGIDYEAGVSLRRVVSMLERTPDAEIDPHFRAQAWFAAGFSFDIVGTLETVGETLAEVARRSGIETPPPKSRPAKSAAPSGGGVCYADEPSGSLRRRGVRPTVSNMLDADLKARIGSRFADDYAMLASAGDPPESRPATIQQRISPSTDSPAAG